MWGDDTARSGIKTNADTQQYGIDSNASIAAQDRAQQATQFNQGLQFDRDQMAQRGQMFGDQLGFDYDALYGNLGLAYDTLGQRGYEFDSNLDYNYWDRGNQFDYMYDRAAMDDMRWGAGEDRQDYYDQVNDDRYYDALVMSLLGGPAPQVPIFNPTGAYGSQISGLSNGNNSSNSWFNDFLSFG